MSAAAERERLRSRLVEALAGVHLESLIVEVYPSGVVINDGECLWSARPGDLLVGVAKVKTGLASVRNGTDDPAEHGFRAYNRLCSVTPCLQEIDASLHARVVKAWRRKHGRDGNWS